MQPYFFIDTGKKFVKIRYDDIVLVEACRNYVRVFTGQTSYMTMLSLRQMEALLPPDLFCRVHRSYIVNIDHIISFVSNKVYVPGKIVPIGESYNKALQKKVTIVSKDGMAACHNVSQMLKNVINAN